VVSSQANNQHSINVKEYIAGALTKVPKNDLEQALLRSGWPRVTIEKYFSQVPKEGDQKNSILSLNNISKKYDRKTVLSNVSFTVYKKDLLGILGVTGSGKTTLLHIIAGVLSPTNGSVTKLTSLGISPQNPALHEHLTAKENIEHFAREYNIKNGSQKVDDLLKLVKLFDDKDTKVEDMSSGMKKRLDVACAIVHDPQVLILDEPLADIDPVARRTLWDILKKINGSGTTILLTSHLVDELSQHCSRIAVLKAGRLIDLGTIEDLRGVYTKNFEVHIKCDNMKLLLSNIPKENITNTFEKDGCTIFATSDTNALAELLLNESKKLNVHIEYLSIQQPTLSEVFEDVVS